MYVQTAPSRYPKRGEKKKKKKETKFERIPFLAFSPSPLFFPLFPFPQIKCDWRNQSKMQSQAPSGMFIHANKWSSCLLFS
jgi:hypothetical protein